ncbi:MAG: RagB/SusD family nutrient uptake outer membrane protein [Tannerellaceae bacterium]|jgi:hypothetical protein|nr:RagB/SusD family nutrient uptake outer membrane protein [Tannerellaceae bacterium]
MIQQKTFINITLAAILSCTILSCDDLLDINLPSDQLTVETVFTDSATVESAVGALYSQNFYMNPIYYYYPAYFATVMSDEAKHDVVSLEVYNQNSYEATTSSIGNIWEYAYQSIFLSNTLIRRLQETTAISEERKKQFIGAAKYFRAYSFFVLINFYGDVPLPLDIDYKKTMTLPRESMAVIYEQIIADLKDAENGLVKSTNETNKITFHAASALLARAYLYAEKWTEAETKANEVITGGGFQLETLDRVFLRSSKETILKIQDWRTSYIGRTYWGGYVCRLANYNRLRDNLLNAFDEGDGRKTQWTGSISGREYNQCLKYVQTRTPLNTELSEDHVMLRLAEQYLIRAEARAQQGKLSDAIDDLNAIRKRASLSPLSNILSKEEVLLAVEKERQVEFFSEEAHRWWDLKRTGRIDAVLSRIKDKQWESHKAIWPIPEKELNYNPNLTPSPGYGKIN